MSLNAATLRLMLDKGLSLADVAELAEAMEARSDPTAAARMRRHRAKKAERVTVTRNVTANGVSNDIYSNLPQEPVIANAITAPLHVRVVDSWNAGPAAAGATKATALDAGRRKWLAARVKDHGEPAVFDAIRNLAGSDWHTGKGSGGWKANIGWLLKSPENFLKALEMAEPANGHHAKPAATPEQLANAREYQDLEARRKRGEISFAELCKHQVRLLGRPPPELQSEAH